MTDEEYLVLDELYFIIDFEDLADRTEIPEERLKRMLIDFYAKGWIRCFTKNGEEVSVRPEAMQDAFREYRYLISKDGLFAHHRRP